MNQISKALFILVVVISLWACGNSEKREFGEALIKLEETYAKDETKGNEVIAKLNEYVTKFPADIDINARYLFRIGEIYFEQKDYKNAITALNEGIEKFRNEDATPKSYKLLGDIYKLEGNVMDAILAYSKLTTTYPNHPAAKEAATAIPDNEALNHRISKLEAALKDTTQRELHPSFSRELARNLHQYALINPSDEKSADKLLQAGDFYGNIGDLRNANKVFDVFMERYPEHPDAAMAIFYKGFFNENMAMRSTDEKEKYLAEAEKYYKKVIQDYPKSEWAKQAKTVIQYLGKSADEMLESIKNK